MNSRSRNTRRLSLACAIAIPLLSATTGCAFMTEIWDDFNRMRHPNQIAESSFDPRPYASTAVVTQSALPDDQARAMQSLAEGIFNEELKKHGYTLTTRSDLDKAFEEQNLSRSGLTQGQIAQVGQIASVPGVIIVTIVDASVGESRSINGKTESQTRVTVRSELLDVETAEIMWTQTKEGTSSGRDSFGRATSEAAEWLAKRVPTLRPTVHFRSDPRGAKVHINGELVGTTPHMFRLDSLEDVEVTISRPGYQPFVETITPTDGMKFEADLKVAAVQPTPAVAPDTDSESTAQPVAEASASQ